MKRRLHPLTWLVVWLGIALIAALFALVAVVSQLPADQQLDRAHTAGMHIGQQMCLGFRSELERAAQPAARPQRGGLL